MDWLQHVQRHADRRGKAYITQSLPAFIQPLEDHKTKYVMVFTAPRDIFAHWKDAVVAYDLHPRNCVPEDGACPSLAMMDLASRFSRADIKRKACTGFAIEMTPAFIERQQRQMTKPIDQIYWGDARVKGYYWEGKIYTTQWDQDDWMYNIIRSYVGHITEKPACIAQLDCLRALLDRGYDLLFHCISVNLGGSCDVIEITSDVGMEVLMERHRLKTPRRIRDALNHEVIIAMIVGGQWAGKWEAK